MEGFTKRETQESIVGENDIVNGRLVFSGGGGWRDGFVQEGPYVPKN